MNYRDVQHTVASSGIWEGGENHKFILSPSVYEITPAKKDELGKLGQALHECLGGLGRVATIAFNPTLHHSNAWNKISRVLGMEVPNVYRGIMPLKPSLVPAICKVDLMEATDSRYFIAEIDGHNKHGLGYSTLAAHIRRMVRPGARSFPGVAVSLASEVKRRNKGDVTLLYSDRERFYLPEFRILRAALADLGIRMVVVAESDVSMNGVGNLAAKDGSRISDLFVDFPFLSSNQFLNTRLADLYREGEIGFLIPPKPFFGSKAALALLKNDERDDDLEAILASQIPRRSLELLRQYIPQTYLIHKAENKNYWRGKMDGTSFVLKESISSGMKGVVFASDPEFEKTLDLASRSFYRFILQEEVNNRPQKFQFYSRTGELLEDEWFMRITVHYAMRSVADVIVTARRDKKVHGAPDSLQLGTIVLD